MRWSELRKHSESLILFSLDAKRITSRLPPRAIAIYIVVYAVVTQMPWWDESWRGILGIDTPGTSAFMEVASI